MVLTSRLVGVDVLLIVGRIEVGYTTNTVGFKDGPTVRSVLAIKDGNTLLGTNDDGENINEIDGTKL